MKKKYKKASTEKAVEKGTGTLARTIKKTRPKVETSNPKPKTKSSKVHLKARDI